jgi:hypothetical protein
MKADAAETVLERLQGAWQLQPAGERQFFGVVAQQTRWMTTFRWANYLTGTGGLLGNVVGDGALETALRLLDRLGELRGTCRRGSLLRPQKPEPVRRRPPQRQQLGARKETAKAKGASA